jgi:hypothetical protein
MSDAAKTKPGAKPKKGATGRQRKAKKTLDEVPNWKRQRGGRHMDKPKDRAGNEKFGQANPSAVAKIKRTLALKALIEPRTEELVQVMVDIALDKEVDPTTGKETKLNVHPSIRLEAASRLLDRAYGKPKETLALEADDGPSSDQDEVTQLLNNILEKLGAPLLEPLDPVTVTTNEAPAAEGAVEPR